MDLDAFKIAVGEFATGVAVVTGAKDDVPYGFTVQTFVSLSLKPALVSVCPAKTAASWPEIRGSGHFCVNILSQDQRELSDMMASDEELRFKKVDWRSGKTGSPVLAGALSYVDCRLFREFETGDHTIVVGEVLDFGVSSDLKSPLLYFRGEYGQFGGKI